MEGESAMVDANAAGPRATAEPSTAELVQRASEQISRLVRDELALAKAELTEKGKHAGIGIGLFGGSGVIALYGVGAAIATVIIALAIVLPPWLAALIVTVGLFLLAGLLALVGRGQVKRAVPVVPTEAKDSIQADIDTVSAAVKDRGRA